MTTANDSKNSNDFSEGELSSEVVTSLAPRYKVILHNDDYTTMEFVIQVLERFFHKSSEEAQHLMLKVHQEGSALCGVYSFEVAETKVHKVTQFARENRYPLKVTKEKE